MDTHRFIKGIPSSSIPIQQQVGRRAGGSFTGVAAQAERASRGGLGVIRPFDQTGSFQKIKTGLPISPQILVPILSDRDIVVARQKGCELAVDLGFSQSEAVLIATVISELARNVVLYAGEGRILLNRVEEKKKTGIEIIARDEGPGISDIDKALREGHSTSGSLGKGLPGIKRLMDEFQIISNPGEGTVVNIRKWKP